MRKINTLQDFLVDQLRDLHSAETQIAAALPKMAKLAVHADLRMAFEQHLRETEEHAQRLERIGAMLNIGLGGHTCHAMKGIIIEANEWIAQDAPPDVRDAGLIANAQRVEHYEMAGYGTARTIAERLGHQAVVEVLEKTLQEEKTTDQKLTRLAVNTVNEDAAANRSR
jgi:ferritin-like metal-binding protein YciE